MSGATLPMPISPFERIRHQDEAGEYWSARELMTILEYALWQNFARVVKKAMTACESSGHQVSDHFIDVNKAITGGHGAVQQVKDYHLTRYACYLIAQNADPDKEIVAQAQTYFAVQTRRQELADQAIGEDPERAYLDWYERAVRSYVARGYSESWARARVDGITIRNRLTHEWSVRGITGKEFAILTDELHMGMFGLDIEGHKDLKGMPVVRKGAREVQEGELRDALTEMEIAVVQVGEIMSRALHIARDSRGRKDIERDVKHAAHIADEKRQELTEASGEPIPSPVNTIPGSVGLWDALAAGDGAQADEREDKKA